MPRVSISFPRGRDHCAGVASHNSAEPAGVAPTPRPAIESKVLELVRLGLKVHDIAALLNMHPRAIERLLR